MGGPLFVRVGRTLQLTEAGKVLARHSASILGDLAVARAAGAGDLRARSRHRPHLRAFPVRTPRWSRRPRRCCGPAAPHMRLELIEQEPPEVARDAAPRRVRRRGRLRLRRRRPDDLTPRRHDPHAAAGGAAGTAGAGRASAGRSHVRLEAGRQSTRRSRSPIWPTETWIAGCPTCRVHVHRTPARGRIRAGHRLFAPTTTWRCRAWSPPASASRWYPAWCWRSCAIPEVVALPVEPVTWRRMSAYTWPDLARVDAIRKTLSALTTVAKRLS